MCPSLRVANKFLPTFNRPNVTMVDTNGSGVERVTATGVVVNGVEYPVDCLIFATGFEVGTAYTRRAGFDVLGRDGLALSDYWANGMRTCHGFLSHSFPNCFHNGNHLLLAHRLAEIVGDDIPGNRVEPSFEGRSSLKTVELARRP